MAPELAAGRQGPANEGTSAEAGQNAVDGRFPLRVDVAWLSAAGVGLYVLLRFPFAIFYGKLGTSPEDVGLGYVTLLAQSSVLIAIIALSSLSAILGLFGIRSVSFPAGGRRAYTEMSDAQYSAHLAKIQRAMDSNFGLWVARTEFSQISRLRELDRKGVLDRQETYEQRHLSSWIQTFRTQIIFFVAKMWQPGRRSFRLLFTAWALIYTVIVLPLIASFEADRVRNCLPALSIAGLDYGGRTVQLLDKALVPQFTDRDLLLLGGDSNRYVLFDCRHDSTLHVPTSDYVAVHNGEGR